MNCETNVEVIHRAADLPDHWDAAAAQRFFLKRSALRALEDSNPCGQRYHMAGKGNAYSIAVTYQHKLNLFTYGQGSFNIPVTLMGIPCSVSDSGYCIAPGTEKIMARHLHQIRGAKLLLNTPDQSLEGFKCGTTLPNCRLNLSWDDFPGYLSAMRSHYRRRVNKARQRGVRLITRPVDRGNFDENLHRLYTNVFNRSRYKLEKLPLDFFNRFPADITQFTIEDQPVAFVQTVQNGNELIFMFAGMDYTSAKQHDTYLNILLYTIKKGIDAGCRTINMGQTAEEIKCKLGCKLEPRHMHIAHSNRIGNLALQSLSGLLCYKQKDHEYRVFR